MHKSKDKENGNIKEDIKEKNIEINKKDNDIKNIKSLNNYKFLQYNIIMIENILINY